MKKILKSGEIRADDSDQSYPKSPRGNLATIVVALLIRKFLLLRILIIKRLSRN